MHYIMAVVYYVILGLTIGGMLVAMAFAWLLEILVGPYTLITGDYPQGWP